jgi:hypothetical protein
VAVALLALGCGSDANGNEPGSSGAGANAVPSDGGGVPDVGLDAAATGDVGDGSLVVPEHLEVMELPGGCGVLQVTALTLRKGPDATEVYAALMNVGDAVACSAGFSVELYDRSEQWLATGISGLLSQRFFRRTDGSDTIAACVAPGDVSMAALTDLPADIVIDDVGYAIYRCPHFVLEVEPIDGLTISDVRRVQGGRGTAFRGTLTNGFDIAVADPLVIVFPVNRVGRPLGAARGTEMLELAPGGSWSFETDVVDEAGVDQVAFPAAALGN